MGQRKKKLSHRQISSLGGKASMAKLTPEERRARAMKGVEARRERSSPHKRTLEAGHGR